MHVKSVVLYRDFLIKYQQAACQRLDRLWSDSIDHATLSLIRQYIRQVSTRGPVRRPRQNCCYIVLVFILTGFI